MGSFIRKPYVYAVFFGLAMALLLAWSLLSVFVIPKELEQPDEEYETIDFSRFTRPASTTTPSEPDSAPLTEPPGDTLGDAQNGTLDEALSEAIGEPNPESPNESMRDPLHESLDGSDESADEPIYTLTLPATTSDEFHEPEEPTTATEPATEPPTEPPTYPIITENSYLDENISITISTLRRFGSDFHVAEIRLSDPQYLKTALAKDTYGLNIKEKTSTQARRVGAILAINGDYYGANEKGYVIRNGVLYRKTVRPTDDKRHKYFEDLAILWDGTFMPFDEKSITGSELLGMGTMQSLAFGPTLIKNGEITVDENTEVGISHPGGNPRTAICCVGEGHYLFVVADGRTDASKGPTLLELATVLRELGAVTAYNLDGGGSATMYFNGKLVNNPCTDWNEIHEREVSDIVYIGY